MLLAITESPMNGDLEMMLSLIQLRGCKCTSYSHIQLVCKSVLHFIKVVCSAELLTTACCDAKGRL